MTLDQKNFDPFFDLVVVVLKPFNYLPWSSRPKKTFQHIFGLAPFGLKIFDLKIFGVEKFGLAAPSPFFSFLTVELKTTVMAIFFTFSFWSKTLPWPLFKPA